MSSLLSSLLYIPWFRAEKFTIPGLDFIAIQPFGLLVATGVILAIFVGERYAARHGWSPAIAGSLAMHMVIFGFAGGMILNTVFYYPERIGVFFERLPGMISDFPNSDWSALPFTGLSSFGGFIGATIGIFYFQKKTQIPFMPVGDAIAFCFPFGWFFGRMGCFVVHDHPGKETDFFLAVADYQVGAPPYVPRHDLGLYEVLWSAAMIGLMLYLLPKKRKPGLLVAITPVLYAPIRFFLDYLRIDKAAGGDARYFGLTPGQYSSIAFMILGVWLLRRVLIEPAQEVPESIRWDKDSGKPPPPPPNVWREQRQKRRAEKKKAQA